MFLIIGQIFLRQNRFYRTDRNARAAIDADVVIDVNHLRVGVETSNRTYRNAFSKAAKLAVIGYYDGHSAPIPFPDSLVPGLLTKNTGLVREIKHETLTNSALYERGPETELFRHNMPNKWALPTLTT